MWALCPFLPAGCSVVATTKDRVAAQPLHPYTTVAAIQEYLEQSAPSFPDLSYLLFTSNEEQKALNGWGCYAVPPSPHTDAVVARMNTLSNSHYLHHSQFTTATLPYAGLFGVIPQIRQIVRYNVLDHPLLENLRQGDWLLRFLLHRLDGRETLRGFQSLLREEFQYIQSCPKSSRPVKFCRFMAALGDVLERYVAERMQVPPSLSALALATLQFTLPVPADSKPLITAGFPFFSEGIMRDWGRDTFIAFPGLLLATHRFDEARYVLLKYASVARHGLICNLFDGGRHPRYNSRDAVWWWLLVGG